MEFLARYQDGLTANVHDVFCVVDLASEPVALVIIDRATRQAVAVWAAADVYLVHSRPQEIRIGAVSQNTGARVMVQGLAEIGSAWKQLPALAARRRADGLRQFGFVAGSTIALCLVIFAYLYGVPLLADRLVPLVPPAWETQLGNTADDQIEQVLSRGTSFLLCDPNANSVANRALARFVHDAYGGLNSPFRPRVEVVYSDIANAFALPGGKIYVLSPMLEAARTPDEFAGVLAHELGHVYYRHGMQTLIATSATGLLVGFVLGDMTGLSVAGGIGAALIDNRFSRESESQADAFAAETAHRMSFQPSGFVDLIERVAKDDEYSKAWALFSNHPLTEERRAALAAMDVPIANPKPAFDVTEWQAIKAMCSP